MNEPETLPRAPGLAAAGGAAAHAAMAPFIAHAKAHKELFAANGRASMPPLVIALDETGAPLVEAIVHEVQGGGPNAARDAALRVAERLARGVSPSRIVLATDGDHRTGDGDTAPEPRGARNGAGKCLVLVSVTRSGDAGITDVPYEWDRGAGAGPRWSPGDERTATFGGAGRIGGVVIDGLRAVMDLPFYADDPVVASGLPDTPAPERWRAMARTTLAYLFGAEGCILKVYGERFGTDIEEFIQRTAPRRDATAERVREMLRKAGDEVAAQNRQAELLRDKYLRKARWVENRPSAAERCAARRRVHKKNKKKGGAP